MNLLSNWKTSAVGLFVVAMAAFETLTGIDVPGFNMGLSEAITIAIGLFVAKDVNVTGGTVKQ